MKKSYAFVLMAFLLGQCMFAQNQNVESIIQSYLTDSTTRSELTAQDISEWQITDVVPSLNPAIQHVYVQQLYQGIPIQNGTYKLTVKNGQISWTINQFITEISTKARSTQASITPENAIMAVTSKHNMAAPSNFSRSVAGNNIYTYDNSGISPEPIKAEQVYYYEDGNLYLTWRVSVYQNDGLHWWSDNVDATTGQVLHSEDWVISCSFGDTHETHNHGANTFEAPMGPVTSEDYEAATAAPLVGGGSYNVYPLGIESPSHGNRAIVNDPAVASASPFGWHDTNGSAGAEFTITRGNNVWAQDDLNGNNGTGSSPNGGSSLNFNFPLNLNNAPSTFLNAATTNLFYWNNIMHDVWYQYGFDEASGNFQENNYGNGGAGSDSVNADAQDGSGTNNANFGTPPDGQNPRMQMFLFTNPTRDGDLDNVIIAHEYGHGISTRLVGGPSSNNLGGSEQMGEGWSDWFGLVMTIRPGDNRNTARGVGTYAIGQPTTGAGIRPTRYSTDLAVNGTTYGDIGGLAVPHGVGYGFATILWDMTWDLIDIEGFDADQYNGTGGNNIAMALVTEGLKNTANNPGYVSGRNGILQADQDLYGGQYNCLIWDAFARRGVGVDAVENTNGGTNTNNDQAVSFVSGCSGPPPPASCNSTVASFPYTESFENTLGAWSQDASNDFDWAVNSGGTPSNNTGPTGAVDGNFYIYMEVSDPNFPSRTAILNSPCFNLAGATGASADFQFQMTGNAVGTIRLEVREDGSNTWTQVWSRTGDQGAAWQSANVDLSAFSGTIQLRFNGTSGNSWQGDIAIDGFELTTSSADTQAPSAPTNLIAASVAETEVGLSWNASTDNVGVTGYEVFLDGNALGTVTGTTANVTGLVAATNYNFRVRAQDAAGNVSGFSNTLNVTTTGGASGCTGGVSAPYSESFEANFGLWTQGGGDDLNWTRDSNGTPSNGTGPSSGSVGAFYVYVEASGNGTGFPNKRAILNSPCFDLSGETDASFVFDNHMFGSTDGGRVDLEASDDNGATWTSIWSQTGNQGNQWNTVSINLAAYVGGGVQLRFNRVTGGTWQSDFALDNARLVSGAVGSGCVGGVSAPYGEGFESNIGLWTQAAGDDLNWTRDSNGTPSNNTGPSSGSVGAFYIYVEASGNGTGFPNKRAIINSPCLDLNSASGATFSFDYHMFGSNDGGRVDLEISDDDGATWISIWNQTGNQGNQWNGVSLDLSAYVGGGVQLRFNRITGGTWRSDVAIDNISLSSTSATSSFGGDDTASFDGSSTIVDFSIFPNPVTDGKLNINVPGTKPGELTIYNLLGQTVRRGAFADQIDVSNLEAGIYILEIEVEGTIVNRRFIKK